MNAFFWRGRVSRARRFRLLTRLSTAGLAGGLFVCLQAQSAKPLLLVGNNDYAPLSYLANGKPAGLDVEMAQAIGRAMGRDVRIELMDWDAARDSVLRGEADGLIDLGVSDSRREAWAFTAPTMTHEFQLFVRSSEVVIRGVGDLAGKRVGVAPGGFPSEFLQTQPRVTLVPIDSYDDGFARLQRGAVHAVAADSWVGAYTIQQRGLTGIGVAGEPFAKVPAGIAVKKGNTELVKAIDRAIRGLQAKGTLAAIQAQWRPHEVVFVSRALLQRYMLILGGAFALVIVGALGGWVVMLKRQIRERRRMETALVENRERLGLALSSAAMGTWRWTAATDTAIADSSVAAMLGRDPVETTTNLERWFEQLHPDDRAGARAQFDQALRNRQPFTSEFRLVRADDQVRWLRMQGRPYYDESGSLAYVTGIAVDITDRRLADEALRASEEKFAKAFEAGPDCVAISDFERGIVEVSPRFETLTGYPREEVIGRTLVDVGLVTAEQRAEFIRQLRRTGSIRDYELQVHHKDGSLRIGMMSADVLEIGGRPCFLSVSRDVTDKRRLEANLQRASEINRLLVSELEPEPLYSAITESLSGVLPLDYAGVVLQEAGTGELRVRAHTFYHPRGEVSASDHARATAGGRTPASVAIERGDVCLFTRADLESFGAATAPLIAEDLRTLCGAPLRGRHGTFGVLCVGSRRDQAFSDDDVALIRQLSTYIAIAIENAQNHEQVLALKNQLAEEKLYLEEEIRGDHGFSDIIGQSPALKRVLQQIRTVAPTSSTVLLLGETGTGKELLARSLHDLSPRHGRTFVKVNAAALPATLLESELFGYERGAFTGATASKIGRFELANRGSLFLDEVGDIPLDLQPKLLRVLQEREFERLGSTRVTRVDVRLIAATNRHLDTMASDGTFRSDLYYRLNVFPVQVPPLRERPEDIPLLVRHFVRRFSSKLKREIETIPSATMEALQRWHWPGNIRELENVIERALIISPGPVLQVPIPELAPAVDPGPSVRPAAPSPSGATLEAAEREMILRALREAKGVIAGEDGAAARLGLKRTTLHSKMRKLGIRRASF